MHGIVEVLTLDLFPGTPAFHPAGREGVARLESALAQPHWPHHRTAQQKAAALHYSLNKNHPFVDGNKRMAVTAMAWFLFSNGFMLLATSDQLLWTSRCASPTTGLAATTAHAGSSTARCE